MFMIAGPGTVDVRPRHQQVHSDSVQQVLLESFVNFILFIATATSISTQFCLSVEKGDPGMQGYALCGWHCCQTHHLRARTVLGSDRTRAALCPGTVT